MRILAYEKTKWQIEGKTISVKRKKIEVLVIDGAERRRGELDHEMLNYSVKLGL